MQFIPVPDITDILDEYIVTRLERFVTVKYNYEVEHTSISENQGTDQHFYAWRVVYKGEYANTEEIVLFGSGDSFTDCWKQLQTAVRTFNKYHSL